MSSENDRENPQEKQSDLDQLTDTLSEQMAHERSAKRRQLILVVVAALGCAIFGLMLFT